MKYPVVLHKDPASCFGVTVPDLPGCFSAGATVDEALAQAHEAILGHLAVLIELGQAIPRPRPIEEHKQDPDHADAYLWAVVDVDPARLPGKAVRVNISMQERVLDRVDHAARAEGETRSGLLQRAVLEYIEQHRPPTAPRPRTGRKRSTPKRAR